jgi:hypothetical protein
MMRMRRRMNEDFFFIWAIGGYTGVLGVWGMISTVSVSVIDDDF